MRAPGFLFGLQRRQEGGRERERLKFSERNEGGEYIKEEKHGQDGQLPVSTGWQLATEQLAFAGRIVFVSGKCKKGP